MTPLALESINHCAMAITQVEQQSGVAGLRAEPISPPVEEAVLLVACHETATVAGVLLIRRSGDEAHVTDEMLDATALHGTLGDTASEADELRALFVDEVGLRFPESIDGSMVRGQNAQLTPFASPTAAGNAVTMHEVEQ